MSPSMTLKLKVRVRRDLFAQHCILDVFAGHDEDHLTHCGRLTMLHVEADAFLARLSDDVEREAA